MSDFTIYIGTKNISSWSLRGWLMLKHAEVDFKTVYIELMQADTQQKVSQISPSKKIPVLNHNNHLVWDSLAIGEYLAEIFPEKNFWPKDPLSRSLARSLSSEMHAGFPALREHLSMNISARLKNQVFPTDAQAEIQRIVKIWEQCRGLHHEAGEFLFGHFTIADAMFAPVATRFRTYDVKLPAVAAEYMHTILELPAMQEWCDGIS